MKKGYIAAMLLIIIFASAFPPAAVADVITAPDNDFYNRNYADCVALQRSFYANGRNGSVSLKDKPGSKNKVVEFENGAILFIMFTYNLNGEIWGVTEIWETRKSGWVPMDDLLLVYDYISFDEDHQDELYTYSDVYDALQEIPDLIFWTWPGSGEIHHVLESSWRRGNTEHESIFLAGDKPAYKDKDGHEWVFVQYLFGRINAWICLGDPLNYDIPAFNPAPEPALWQPGDEQHEPPGGLSLPLMIIILVAFLAIGTVILIMVFWKKPKTAVGEEDETTQD